jgi:hypothetical protein
MMPSSSSKQHNFMAAVANNPAFAKKAGVPQSVGKEFVNADKGKTFKQGGEMKESKGMMKKEVGFMKAKGAPKSMIKHEEAEMKGMKKGGAAKKMAAGGKAMPTSMGSVRTAAPSRDGVASKGKTKGMMVSMKKGGKAC